MDDIVILDTVRADTLEGGEQVALTNEDGGTDYLENVTVLHETDTVMIRGYSWLTGDTATYFVPWDSEVDLWAI